MRRTILTAILAVGITLVPLAPTMSAGATTNDCTSHPRNAAGFVTDGSPQCGPQWCVGPNPGQFACLVAIYPHLIEFLNNQWAASHPTPVQTASVAQTASAGELHVTAYCLTGTMADGNQVHYGAAAGNRWPFGTRLYVPGYGTVTIEDRIGYGSDLDIAMPGDCGAAGNWGSQYLNVSYAGA